jgi:hypothetical protein
MMGTDSGSRHSGARQWVYLLCIVGFFLVANAAMSQETLIQANSCPEKDLPDVIREWRKKPPKDRTANTGSLLLVPVILKNPATGFALGAAGQYAFLAKGSNSLYSSINGNATVSQLGQVMLQLKNNIYLNDNKMFLSGDWRYFIFSQDTYGLGTSAPIGGVLDYQFGLNGWDVGIDSLRQPMNFNHYRFHQTVSWKVKPSIFIGFGYHFDMFDKIVDHKLDTTLPFYTSHFVFSRKYGFNPEKYVISGFSFNATYDSRDNLVNPYKGIFFNLNWRLNQKFLGSANNTNLATVEYRSYHGLSKSTPRHLIGFWVLGNFTIGDPLPYLGLPALAYDQRGRAGRGYVQGRFRGPNMVYAETEYRFPLSKCSDLVGGVLFANFTTTTNPGTGEKLFRKVAPAAGFGFRLKVDKHSRTNLQLDFAFGQRSSAVYLGAAETF